MVGKKTTAVLAAVVVAGVVGYSASERPSSPAVVTPTPVRAGDVTIDRYMVRAGRTMEGCFKEVRRLVAGSDVEKTTQRIREKVAHWREARPPVPAGFEEFDHRFTAALVHYAKGAALAKGHRKEALQEFRQGKQAILDAWAMD